jgi:IclR family KDG regulon transcriptional repressor
MSQMQHGLRNGLGSGLGNGLGSGLGSETDATVGGLGGDSLHADLDDPSRVQVVSRVSAILAALASHGPELGIVQMVELTGLSKGTLHRLLAGLEAEGLVRRNPSTRRYRLGFRLFELGTLAVESEELVQRAQSVLEYLANEFGETAHLGVLDDVSVLYVSKVEGWHAQRMQSQVGKRIDAYCTGLGKALLAFSRPERVNAVLSQARVRRTHKTIANAEAFRRELACIRERGYALDDEELAEGLRCIAAPIRSEGTSVVGAISLSGPSSRFTRQAVPRMAKTLVRCATELSNPPELLGRSR